jgi:hypothetical protein
LISLAGAGLVIAAAFSPGGAPCSVAPPGEACECEEAFDPAGAEQVFEALRSRGTLDGCELSDVRTERTRMIVQWTRGAHALPPAAIDPRACAPPHAVAGEVLALTSPPDLSAACPGAVSAMTDVVRTIRPRTFPAARVPSARWSYPRRRATLSWIAVAVALLGSSLVVVRVLRRPTPPA